MDKLLDRFITKWFLVFGLGYALLVIAGVYLENFYVMVAPAALLIVYAAFYHLDKLFMLVVFCTPLSMNIEEFGVEGIGLYLPTEPILFGIMLIYIIKNFYKSQLDLKFFKHPATIAVTVYMVWLFLTCITSENPMISWKYFLARMWFIIPIFYFGVQVFSKQKNIKRFLWMYLIPLIIVCLYTLIRHAIRGFDEESGHWVMSPFFKDHTSYGAILALFYPLAVGMLLWRKYSITLKLILFFVVTVLTIALIYSYTRAAWISIAAAVCVYIAMRLRIKLAHILAGVAFVAGLLWMNWEQIQIGLERNKAEHATEDFAERLESVSNISSDASNLERLNLWNSAISMFEERPMMGWGPGTFQFNYGQFQYYKNLTIISQKSGRSVNAHSEYLGPLAESGVLGMLTMIAVVVLFVWTGITTYFKLPPGELRMITLVVLMGLITYFVHGVLNNYMDTDKANIPVWGFGAILVAIDLYHSNKSSEEEAIEAS